MPTYTYRCNSCNNQFDVRQRMADAPLTDCPNCDVENSLRKVLNSVGIVFKGSGFYITDNRGKKNGVAPSANGKTSENGDTTSAEPSAKADSGTKTAGKPDAAPGKGKKKAEQTAV